MPMATAPTTIASADVLLLDDLLPQVIRREPVDHDEGQAEDDEADRGVQQRGEHRAQWKSGSASFRSRVGRAPRSRANDPGLSRTDVGMALSSVTLLGLQPVKWIQVSVPAPAPAKTA